MSKARAFDRQFDLFVPFVADMPLRDQRETMERPFFSLSKKKRVKPIEYKSPDGGIYVKITADAEYGMANIWDADILIWAASVLCDMKKKGCNDIPRTLQFQPYDLLRTIKRDTGGREYKLLREALSRLQATTIATNIRADKGKKKQRQFSWIEGLSDLTDESGEQSLGMTFTLSDWFYEGVLSEGSVLAIDPEYFSIKGGRERWLYRVARKHAGGAGETGFAIPLPTLFDKSGAEGTYRRFKFEILKISREDGLPSFALRIEEKAGGEPILRMVRRDLAEPFDAPAASVELSRPKPAAKPARKKKGAPAPLPLFGHAMQASDRMIAKVRKDFAGWDVYALKAEFDAWLHEDDTRTPENYDAAFYGFVKRFVARG
jgi:plasmid replication initiation protein